MKTVTSSLKRCAWIALVLVTAAVAAQAQTDQKSFEPSVGQAGKDVVWVPSPQELVDRMLEMAKVTPRDIVMDLGSGDGRTVITAAKLGARAMGVEFNPDMVALSKRNAVEARVTERATFTQGDLFEADLSKATVITLFLLPDINIKLRPKLLDLKPGTRVVSNTFSMAEWASDASIDAGGDCQSWCSAMLWIIPAKVGGTWRVPQGELTLSQEFQMLTGTLRSGASSATVEGRMNGEEISLKIGGDEYAGRVSGNTIKGTIASRGATMPWTATRAR